MSTKEKRLWQLLLDVLVGATYDRDRPVTAGEVAKEMGWARSTAVRHLKRLVVMNEVEVCEQTGKNHQTMHTYERVGYGAAWRKKERQFYPGDWGQRDG